MKCISCATEISPKWTHAIDTNVCPFCGKNIMEEHLKNLFHTLRSTMESLVEYSDQLNDWMLSNHGYIKIDSTDLINYIPKEQLKSEVVEKPEFDKPKNTFIVKVQGDNGVEEVVAEKIQSEERTNDFFKRAEVIRPNRDGFHTTGQKNDHLKKMVQQIKKTGSATIDSEGQASHISPEMMEGADPEAVSELESAISGESISSSLSDNGDDDIPQFVLNMANGSKGGGKSNAADLLKLQQQHDRLKASRENFESGGNRGGKGGGFSRSG